mgnify:CR=1 FL=1
MLWGVNAYSQPQFMETISIEQGLSQGFVPAICQDDDGFLWFATKNGLNRYDGYQFQVFKNDPFDSLSLANNEIILLRSCGDYLVLLSEGKDLQLFHRQTQRFYSLPHFFDLNALEKILPLGDNAVAFLKAKGETKALHIVRWPSDLIERLEKGESITKLIQIEQLFDQTIILDADAFAPANKIWLPTPDAVLVYDFQTGKTQKVNSPVPLKNTQKKFNAHYIMGDIAGATWIFQESTLLRYNGARWDSFELPFSYTKLIYTDRKGGFFWFLKGNTLYGLDVKKTPFQPVVSKQLVLDRAPVSCFTDQSGNLWLGTDAHGIRKISPRSGVYKNYMEGYSVYCQPVFNEKKQVFLGDVRSDGSSIVLLDLQSNQMMPLSKWGLQQLNFTRGVATENGRFWFFTNQGQVRLICMDPETDFVEAFPLPSVYSTDPMLRFVAPAEIWILSNKKISCFNIASRQFSSFDNPRGANSEILAVERSPNGTWWLGYGDGLYKAEPDGNGQFRFSTITAQRGNQNSLPANYIKSLLIDPADPNVLWIGTNGKGLSRMDIAKNQFTHYTTKNGLPDDVVYGILADDEKPRKLWISTNHGLTRFSPEANLFQYFLKSDGLQDNEFNSFASFKAQNGELFFGGVNGLTVFNPKNLITNTVPPSVHLTSLRVNGKLISPRDENALLDKDIAFSKRLELPFSKNSIVLQFASSDYTAPKYNQFAYYLEGAEPKWAHRGFDYSAQYLNLAPGKYTFWVKASNSSGVWNEQPISLVIVIQAPWYRTQWAYLAYACFLAMAGYYFYTNQLQRKLQHAEAERLKGLDDFKNRFFTNITHEFRTPLTVILGASEQVEARVGDDLKGPMKLIRRSGENLLRLINQILDLSKLESNSLKANYVQGDVLPYLRYIAESLHSLANAQNVMLRVESDQAKIVMDYDPERLLQIGYNLLSNAIKFTPGGGKVTMRAELNDAKTPSLRLTVTDTGAGIPSEDLPHIFDRFYQANNLEKAKTGGTGIGLALTKELVTLLGGEIAVISELGKGTTFAVTLPITQLAPSHDPAMVHTGPNPPAVSPSSPIAAPFAEILIIEDNPDVVEYLSACLRDHYALNLAYNGKAGIEIALETVPDLIISDVMMPEKDGFEVVETLKNDEHSSHIPIVLLTAKADQASRIAGLKKGADAYLAKPFHREELLATINNLLEMRRKLQSKYAAIAGAGFQTEGLLSGQSVFPSQQPVTNLEDAFLEKIRAIVEKNLSDPDFEMPQLERAVGMSRSQIFRKMKALTGKSPSQFIRSIRLHHGQKLLQTTELTVSEIAYEVGFANVKYFSDAFLEEFGVRPTDVRK